MQTGLNRGGLKAVFSLKFTSMYLFLSTVKPWSDGNQDSALFEVINKGGSKISFWWTKNVSGEAGCYNLKPLIKYTVLYHLI